MSRPESCAPLGDYLGTLYDITRHAAPYLVEPLIHHIDAECPGTYLDIASDTGNYTLAVAQPSLRVHGIDQLRRLIAAARDKSQAATWHIGRSKA